MKKTFLTLAMILSLCLAYVTPVVQAATFNTKDSNNSAKLQKIYDEKSSKIDLDKILSDPKTELESTKEADNDNKIDSKVAQKGTVEVYYKDKATDANIALGNGVDHITLTGDVGTTYYTEEKKFTGYFFDYAGGSTTGQFNEKPQTVTYYYIKADENGNNPNEGAVTVKYLNVEDDQPVKSEVVMHVRVGDPYDTTMPDVRLSKIQGAGDTQYELVTDLDKLPTNATGTASKSGVEIVYYYRVIQKKGTVTVRYVDKDSGNAIAADKQLSGNFGDAFDVEAQAGKAPDIKGYTYKEFTGNKTGTFMQQPQTFTYFYTKNPVTGRDVTVRYLDQDTNEEISNTITLSGNAGSSYTASRLPIPGYNFVRIDGQQSGTFTDKPQKVTFYYTRGGESSGPGNDGNNNSGLVDDNNSPLDPNFGSAISSSNPDGSTSINGGSGSAGGLGSGNFVDPSSNNSGSGSTSSSNTSDPKSSSGGSNGETLPKTGDSSQSYMFYIILGIISLLLVPSIEKIRKNY